jgi:hypothetical protein
MIPTLVTTWCIRLLMASRVCVTAPTFAVSLYFCLSHCLFHQDHDSNITTTTVVLFTILLVMNTDLCGEEVTADYPHDEVRNPGVNHFPDGVFQKCRYITMKEREAERDRLRKLRRMKQKNAAKRRAVGATVVPTVGGSDWESDTDSLFNRPMTANNGAAGPTPPGALAINFIAQDGVAGATLEQGGAAATNVVLAPTETPSLVVGSTPRTAAPLDTTALYANVPGGIAGLAMGFDHAWDVELQNQQAHAAIAAQQQQQHNNSNTAPAVNNNSTAGGGSAGGGGSGGHHLIRARAMYVQRK